MPSMGMSNTAPTPCLVEGRLSVSTLDSHPRRLWRDFKKARVFDRGDLGTLPFPALPRGRVRVKARPLRLVQVRRRSGVNETCFVMLCQVGVLKMNVDVRKCFDVIK